MASKATWPCGEDLQRRHQLLAEELGAEVVVDQRRQRIDDLEVAEARAVVALDAPQRDHGRRRDAGRPGEAVDQRAVLGQPRPAVLHALVRHHDLEIAVERHLEFGLVARELHHPRDLLDLAQRAYRACRHRRPAFSASARMPRRKASNLGSFWARADTGQAAAVAQRNRRVIMAAAHPLSEKVKNDTEVTADLAIFVAMMRRDNARWSGAESGRAPQAGNCPLSRVAKRTETRLEVQ